MSHRRKLQRRKGVYGVLAKRQRAQGARYREIQHVTQRDQAAAVWSRLQVRSWRRLAAGQPTAHSTSGAPSPGLQRRARVVGRLGHGAGVGTEELLALVAPAAPDLCSQDY